MTKIAIVLGNRLNDDGSMSSALLERLYVAEEMYLQKKVDKILLTGGKTNPKPNLSEAEVMEKYLIKKGISRGDIMKEEGSLTTLQNARGCKTILSKVSYDKLYLISSASHLYRAYLNAYVIFRVYYRLPVRAVSACDLYMTKVTRQEQERYRLLFYRTQGEKEILIKQYQGNLLLKKRNGIMRSSLFPCRIKNKRDLFVSYVERVYGSVIR